MSVTAWDWLGIVGIGAAWGVVLGVVAIATAATIARESIREQLRANRALIGAYMLLCSAGLTLVFLVWCGVEGRL